MSGSVVLYADTKESLEVSIKVNADPTGTAPQFSLTSTGATTPGSFNPGSWSTSYDSSSQRATARTPLIGSGGAITLTSGTTYDVWIRTTLGGEVAVWQVGSIRCP